MHESSESLLDTYVEDPDRFRRQEARSTCGDYVLVDTHDDPELITSFGYVGGYLYYGEDHIHVATRLSTILSEMPPDKVRIDSDKLTYYLFMSPWFKLPLSSMFKNVHRVPPATTLTLTADGFHRSSYLSARSSPASYAEVMTETVGELEDEDVVVSLSGGVDSTSLACACLEHGIDARAVTFDIGPGQIDDVSQGLRVSKDLGINHEVVTVERPTSGELAGKLETSMKEDLFLMTNERVGFLAPDNPDDELGISGMGPDPLAHRRMFPAPLQYNRYQYLNLKNLAEESLNRLGHRMLHTEFYLSYPRFRAAYLRLASRLYPYLESQKGGVDSSLYGKERFDVLPDGSMEPVLKRTISTELPNIVWSAPDRVAVTQRKERAALDVFKDKELFYEQFDNLFLDTEIDTFKGTLDRPLEDIANPIERLLFYAFCQNTQKAMSNFLGEDFIPLGGPVCWGPSVSYFLNKDHELMTRDTKKQSIQDYVNGHLDTPYGELMNDLPERGWEYAKESELMRRHSHRFTPEESHVLSVTDESTLVSAIYCDVHEMAEKNSIVNKQQNRFLNKILNLELLLDTPLAG